MKEITIADKKIGAGHPCFIIAEAGVNHKLDKDDLKKINAKSSVEAAFRMIDAAKKAGADAIKFQSYKTEKLQYSGTKKPRYQVKNVGDDSEISYLELLKKLETTEKEQIKIADYCKKKGIIFLSTPYDEDSATFLDEIINVPIFKLASIELNNHFFIKYLIKKQKPIILSTGLSNINDVKDAVEIFKKQNFLDKLILLQCTSDYPAKLNEVNLNVLLNYQKQFPETPVGFSDHTNTFVASVGAVAMGAKVIEKHFTLDKSLKGPDHSASSNPDELLKFVKNIREVEKTIGSSEKFITEGEKKNLTMRKYLVIAPQKEGEIITESMLRTLRTGDGVLPTQKNLQKIIGKKLKKNVDKLSPFDWKMIK